MVVRQATLAGGGSYTTEGMVQILGTVSIVDDSTVTTYSMRCVGLAVGTELLSLTRVVCVCALMSSRQK